jgi:hypothetical protein
MSDLRSVIAYPFVFFAESIIDISSMPPFPKLQVAGSIPAVVAISNTFKLKQLLPVYYTRLNRVSQHFTQLNGKRMGNPASG